MAFKTLGSCCYFRDQVADLRLFYALNTFLNQVEVKFVWQISYPPANVVSQGNYFLPKSYKLAVFEEKTRLQK